MIVTGRGNVVVRGWTALLAAVLLAIGGGVAIAVDDLPTWVGSAVGVVLVDGDDRRGRSPASARLLQTAG